MPYTLRHTLSGLSAVALVIALADVPASGGEVKFKMYSSDMKDFPRPQAKTPNGLATEKASQEAPTPKGAAITSPALSGFSGGAGREPKDK